MIFSWSESSEIPFVDRADVRIKTYGAPFYQKILSIDKADKSIIAYPNGNIKIKIYYLN